MKTMQKLEIYSAIGVLVTALIQFFFFIFSLEGRSGNEFIGMLILGLLFLLYPALVIFIGTYLHTAKKSGIGFGMLLICGGIFICLYGYIFLVGLLYRTELKFSSFISLIVWIVPSFFVITTMIFALINTIWLSPKNDKLS